MVNELETAEIPSNEREHALAAGAVDDEIPIDGTCGYLDEPPIRDRALAVVFASRVVHHLQVRHVVHEVLRVCRPGGCLLLGRVVRDAAILRPARERSQGSRPLRHSG